MKSEDIMKLRVYATILVVVGHAIIIYDPTWGVFNTVNSSIILYNLKKFINLIQMPIFVFVSGYLYFRSVEKGKYNKFYLIFKDKFKRLILPFISVIILWMIPIRIIIGLKSTIEKGYLKAVFYAVIGRESGHLWFLPTLFIIFMTMYIIVKYCKVKDEVLIIIFLVMNFISDMMPGLFYISTVFKYYIYFYVGFVIAKNKVDINKINKNNIYFLFITTSILSIFIIKSEKISIILYLITSVSGIIASYLLCKSIKLNEVIKFINKNSFAIYLLHTPIMYVIFNYFSDISPIFLVTINIIMGIGLSIIVAYVLRVCKLNFIIGEIRN